MIDKINIFLLFFESKKSFVIDFRKTASFDKLLIKINNDFNIYFNILGSKSFRVDFKYKLRYFTLQTPFV